MTSLTTIPLFFTHLCDKCANRIQPRNRVICTSPFAAVERTQQRKLEELLLAAAREGRTAELTALVKKIIIIINVLFLYAVGNFRSNVEFIT